MALMEHLKVVLNDPFYVEFYHEELFLVENKYLANKQEIEEKLDVKETEVEKIPVIPTLDKNILILIKFTSDEERLQIYKPLLGKIFASVNLKPTDADIIVLNKFKGIAARSFLLKSNAKYVIGFGIDEKDKYNFAHIRFNGKEIITAAPLEDLGKDVQYKSKLWNLMKNLFQLK